MAPPPPPPPPPPASITLTKAVRGVAYPAFLAAFHDSAHLAACQAAAGDMQDLSVSAWVPDLEELLASPPTPGAPPAPAGPPPSTTSPAYRRMAFTPVVDEPWLPRLAMFGVTEVHTLEPRPSDRAPLRMTGAARLRWARWAKPAHVLDSTIEATPVEWAACGGGGGGADAAPSSPPIPGVRLVFTVTPHLPPWAVGPIKKLVAAGIADMFSDFTARSLAWAVGLCPGAELVEDEAGMRAAVEVVVDEGRGEETPVEGAPAGAAPAAVA